MKLNPKQWILKRLAEALPYPDNRVFQSTFYSDNFVLPGQYRSKDAEHSSAVSVAINWLVRSVSTMPLELKYGDYVLNDDHPVLELLRRPNTAHTYNNLLWQIIRNLVLEGNAYIQILQNPTGLQVLPFGAVRLDLPKQKGERIRYMVTALGATREIPREQIIHMIWQPLDENSYVGQSPLSPAYADILIDLSIHESIYGRLKSPVAGSVIRPIDSDKTPFTADERKQFEETADNLRGTRLGELLFLEGRFEYQEMRGSIAQFPYDMPNTLVESRIVSQLGIALSVTQMKAGLDRSKVGATMTREEKLSYENGVIPLAEKIQEYLTMLLLPNLGYEGFTLAFNTDNLNWTSEEDKKKQVDRLLTLRQAGIRVDETALENLGTV